VVAADVREYTNLSESIEAPLPILRRARTRSSGRTSPPPYPAAHLRQSRQVATITASFSPTAPGLDVDKTALLQSIEQAAHLLPSQGPISVFVHHNTLHAFEDMKFSAAVERAMHVYGCEPYLSEDRYRQEFDRGRIRDEDLTAVLQEDLGDRADDLIGLLGTRFHLRLAMLQHSLHTAPTAELRWVIAETDAARTFRRDAPAETRKKVIETTRRWIMREFRNGSHPGSAAYPPSLLTILSELFESFGKEHIEEWSEETWEAFTLQLLWRICVDGACVITTQHTGPQVRRHRDALREVTDEDADELVHEFLIRFCAAYLDQGFAHWELPERQKGFFTAFQNLYGTPGRVTPLWLRGLRDELQRHHDEGISPVDSIEQSLILLGVGPGEQEEFIISTLLALSGWAGMIWQMETNAEWAVRPAPRGTLVEFLAVRLLLDRFAAAYIAKESMDYRGPLTELRGVAARRHPLHVGFGEVQRAFLFFQLAQVLGLRPEDLAILPM
jgi:uncharacterized protein